MPIKRRSQVATLTTAALPDEEDPGLASYLVTKQPPPGLVVTAADVGLCHGPNVYT